MYFPILTIVPLLTGVITSSNGGHYLFKCADSPSSNFVKHWNIREIGLRDTDYGGMVRSTVRYGPRGGPWLAPGPPTGRQILVAKMGDQQVPALPMSLHTAVRSRKAVVA